MKYFILTILFILIIFQTVKMYRTIKLNNMLKLKQKQLRVYEVQVNTKNRKSGSYGLNLAFNLVLAFAFIFVIARPSTSTGESFANPKLASSTPRLFSNEASEFSYDVNINSNIENNTFIIDSNKYINLENNSLEIYEVVNKEKVLIDKVELNYDARTMYKIEDSISVVGYNYNSNSIFNLVVNTYSIKNLEKISEYAFIGDIYDISVINEKLNIVTIDSLDSSIIKETDLLYLDNGLQKSYKENSIYSLDEVEANTLYTTYLIDVLHKTIDYKTYALTSNSYIFINSGNPYIITKYENDSTILANSDFTLIYYINGSINTNVDLHVYKDHIYLVTSDVDTYNLTKLNSKLEIIDSYVIENYPYNLQFNGKYLTYTTNSDLNVIFSLDKFKVVHEYIGEILQNYSYQTNNILVTKSTDNFEVLLYNNDDQMLISYKLLEDDLNKYYYGNSSFSRDKNELIVTFINSNNVNNKVVIVKFNNNSIIDFKSFNVSKSLLEFDKFISDSKEVKLYNNNEVLFYSINTGENFEVSFK